MIRVVSASNGKVHPMIDVMRKRRVELGLSQEEVAIRAGCALMSLNGYERGNHMPALHIFEAICEVLRLKLAVEKQDLIG